MSDEPIPRPPDLSSVRTPRSRKRLHGPYDRTLCAQQPPEGLRVALDQFNRGEYFEQHETLEELWRDEPDDVRYLYQGILLVGVGCYHARRSNFAGATSKLSLGISLLRWFEPACQGVDVTRLVADSAACLSALRALGPDRIGDLDPRLLPKVRLSPKAE